MYPCILCRINIYKIYIYIYSVDSQTHPQKFFSKGKISIATSIVTRTLKNTITLQPLPFVNLATCAVPQLRQQRDKEGACKKSDEFSIYRSHATLTRMFKSVSTFSKTSEVLQSLSSSCKFNFYLSLAHQSRARYASFFVPVICTIIVGHKLYYDNNMVIILNYDKQAERGGGEGEGGRVGERETQMRDRGG